MVRIILNADDFGKSVGRNQAIDDSFKQGLICSAGLIVTGKHLKEAVEYMNKGGYAKNIHLHMNLSANLLHEDSEDIPLTETMREDPFFCKEGKFIPYKGLSNKFSDIRKWKIVYRELVAQYEKFMEVTNGKGNGEHVDFHLWYNLTWPVSIALNRFTRRYKIKTVRYFGMHQKNNRYYRLLRLLSWNPGTKYIPSTNIDYYLTKKQKLTDYSVMELYCHPNYKEGVFLDDSPSYFGHERQPMIKQIQMLKETGDVELISWEDKI